MKQLSVMPERRGGIRGYNSPGNRKKAISLLAEQGYDHFVCYRDTRSPYALMYGNKSHNCDWCVRGDCPDFITSKEEMDKVRGSMNCSDWKGGRIYIDW